MNLFKKSVAVVMAATMVVSGVTSVFAGDGSSAEDRTFHYIAIGDSVASGFNLSTLDDQGREDVMYVNRNYNNSPKEAYPAVAASLIKDALLEEGYLGDESQFSFSNMGATALKAQDYVNILKDKDYVVGYFEGLTLAYMKPLYDELGEEAFKAMLKNIAIYGTYSEENPYGQLPLKDLLNGYYFEEENPHSWYPYLLSRFFLGWGTKQEFVSFYEKTFLTEGNFDDDKYNAWFETWFEEEYYPAYFALMDDSDYKWHDLFVSEIQKSDLITIDIGGNNLTQGLFGAMTALGIGEDAEYDPMTGLYTNMDNPFFYLVWTMIYSYVSGGNFLSMLPQAQMMLQQYKDQITFEDIVETFQLLRGDAMLNVGKTLVDEALEYIPEYVDMVREINHEAGKDATIALLGRFAPYGNSLVVDGEVRDLSYVVRQVLKYLLTTDPKTGTSVFEEAGNSALAADAAVTDAKEVKEGLKTYDDALEKLTEALEAYEDEAVAASVNTDGEEEEEPVVLDYDELMELMANPYISGLFETLTEATHYSLSYMMMGKSAVSVMDYFNERLQEVAEEKDVLFIENFDIPNQTRSDPHPDVAGHAAIGENIANALVMDINKTVCGHGTITGTSACLYGHDVTLQVKPDFGHYVSKVLVNGEELTDIDPMGETVVIPEVTEDTTVNVVFAAQNSSVDFVENTMSAIRIANIIFGRLRTIVTRTVVGLKSILSRTAADGAVSFRDAISSGIFKG